MLSFLLKCDIKDVRTESKNTLRNAECGMATTCTLRNIGCRKNMRN